MRIRAFGTLAATLASVMLVAAACGGNAATPTATKAPATPTTAATATTAPTATRPATTATAVPQATVRPTATSVPAATPVPATATATGPAVKTGGVLRIAGSHNRGLDPHRNTFNSGIRDLSRLAFNGLVKFDAKGNLVGDLATSWQYDSAGSLVFKLRSGVKFQNVAPVNGRAMTAQDVQFSLNRLMDPKKADPKASLRSNFPTVTDVVVVDPQTVKITLSAPDAELLNYLAHEQAVVLAPEAAIDGSYGDPKSVIGTGPFIGETLQASGGENRFERNPGYFIPGRPYLDGVNDLQNDNPEIRNSLLRTRQLDWTALQNPSDVTYFLARGNARSTSTEGNMLGNTALWFNTTIAPFNDIKVRQAVNLGINRDAIGKGALNNAGEPMGPLGNAGGVMWGLDKIRTLSGNAIDRAPELAAAKKLLEQAGVAKGFKFQLHTDPSYYDPIVAVIQAQLKADLGIEIEVIRDASYNYRFASYVKEKNAQSVFMQWLGSSADQGLYLNYKSTATRNMALMNDPEIDRLTDLQRATLDVAQRTKLLDQAQSRVMDIQPAAFTVYTTWFYVAYDTVQNWSAPRDPFNFSGSQFQDVWLNK